MDVLASAGCPPVTFEFLRDYIGLELRAVFSELLPNCTDTQMDELSQRYSTLYRGRKHVETRVYPGVAEALARLTGLKSTATTKSTAGTHMVLEHFGLLPYFDHVQGTDGFPCKPAPDVVLAAINAMGAKRDECLLVGDSPADMEAGRRAGVKICAVTYGYGAAADLDKWQPDHWVSDLRQLVAE
jgi:phosphoglycolate phosphatase